MSENISIAYKALSKRPDGLASVDSPESLTILYKPNEWTFPPIPNSKLFCFKDYEAALLNYSDAFYQIWRIEAENLIKARFMGPPYYRYSIEKFWATGMSLDSLYARMANNTVFYCDKLKLIERIK